MSSQVDTKIDLSERLNTSPGPSLSDAKLPSLNTVGSASFVTTGLFELYLLDIAQYPEISRSRERTITKKIHAGIVAAQKIAEEFFPPVKVKGRQKKLGVAEMVDRFSQLRQRNLTEPLGTESLDKISKAERILDNIREPVTTLYCSKLRYVPKVIDHPSVRRWTRSDYVRMDKIDLVQEGNMGLLAAIERFDPSRGVNFMTFARFYILQFVRDALRENGAIVSIPRLEFNKSREVARKLDAFLSGEKGASSDQLRILQRRMVGDCRTSDGTYPIRYCRLFGDSGSKAMLTNADVVDNKKGESLEDRLSGGENDVGFFEASLPSRENMDQELSRSELTDFLGQTLKAFERKGAILARVYGLFDTPEASCATVAKELKVSKFRIEQIRRETRERLAPVLERFSDYFD